MESIVAPAIWDERELAGLQASYDLGSGLGDAVTKYNPTPGAEACSASRSEVEQCVGTPAAPPPSVVICAGTGRTGFLPVPPNNYPFYNEDEKYVPMMQADGGQLSGELAVLFSWHCLRRLNINLQPLCCRCCAKLPPEWKPMYQPTPEQAEADRRAAYESGVPHGYVAPGDKYKGLPTIKLVVVSNLVRAASVDLMV